MSSETNPLSPGGGELTYELALEEFDRRVRVLEDGKLPLEEAMRTIEEARGYLRTCESILAAAQARIANPSPGPEATTPPEPDRPEAVDPPRMSLEGFEF